MADNISTLYAKAVAEAQKAAQHAWDNAPGAYEKGKEAALIAVAKVQPALNSAIETTPVLIGWSKVAAQKLYQDAPRHLTATKVVAEQLYQDAPRRFNAAKVAGLNAFENPSRSAKSLLDILGPIVRQNPYSSFFGFWAALAVIFGPLWPVRALLRIFGFGKGITPGSNAAAWQSRQGDVQRKSWFSLFQSYGDRLN
ncbi:hypothetical protein MFRU_002g02720 [Monilinia fructicola]|uniref:Uncharacterized protein n=1 Tax=Monilinia fructicola TaxID=38448 RepID=A0A5M9K3W1_MONFR|nr:hypothetical protein EYC84_004346 [Monilinia fructicola]KAG4034923.1 hypothetical protein MFRU_002g02720 [Monilinia fructicola]